MRVKSLIGEVPDHTTLPEPLALLRHGPVELRFDSITPGRPAENFVPFYHYRIFNAAGEDVGHFNIRVGSTSSVRNVIGHIGYAVTEAHRGHGYAYQACLAAAPFVFAVLDDVLISCNPDNTPSIRTIEKLDVDYLGEKVVPPDDPHYANGARLKRLYRWRRP